MISEMATTPKLATRQRSPVPKIILRWCRRPPAQGARRVCERHWRESFNLGTTVLLKGSVLLYSFFHSHIHVVYTVYTVYTHSDSRKQMPWLDKLEAHGIYGIPLSKSIFLRMVSPGSSKNPLWKSHCWCCGPSRLPQRNCDFTMNDDECTVIIGKVDSGNLAHGYRYGSEGLIM